METMMVQGKRCKWAASPCRWARRCVAGPPQGSGRLHWSTGKNGACRRASAKRGKNPTRKAAPRRG